MEKNSEEQFIPMKEEIENNKEEMKAEMKDIKETLKTFTTFMMDQTNISKYSPAHKDTSTPPCPTTVFPTNKRDPPLEGGHSTKIGDMWTLKHEISSPKCYDLLINTELKGDTDMDLKNFFNHIKMCFNAVTRLREDLLSDYQSIKRHSYFEEYFVPDFNHPSDVFQPKTGCSLSFSGMQRKLFIDRRNRTNSQ